MNAKVSQRAGAMLRTVNSLTGKAPRHHPWLATIDGAEIPGIFFRTELEAVDYAKRIIQTIGWPMREPPKSKVRRKKKSLPKTRSSSVPPGALGHVSPRQGQRPHSIKTKR
jgi:hypothetical protein